MWIELTFDFSLVKSEAALLIAKHSLKELKPVAVEMFNQQKKRTDGCTGQLIFLYSNMR